MTRLPGRCATTGATSFASTAAATRATTAMAAAALLAGCGSVSQPPSKAPLDAAASQAACTAITGQAGLPAWLVPAGMVSARTGDSRLGPAWRMRASAPRPCASGCRPNSSG